MTEELIGRRFWKTGDRTHVWIVDGVMPAKEHLSAYAIMVTEDGSEAEDVDLTHLEDPEQFTPVA